MISPGDIVGIKAHFGDEDNTTYLSPYHFQPLVEFVKNQKGKPFLAETSTLYSGERHDAVDHTLLAHKHGFTISEMQAPVIMLDGLRGNREYSIPIDGDYYSEVSIAADVRGTDVFIIASHVTGHIMSGIAAAIKNLGMGMVSREGKLAQHSDSKPHIDMDKCTLCQRCFQVCPESAITPSDNKMEINPDVCIGCGECITICPAAAVKEKYDTASIHLQKKMTEHACGVMKAKKDKMIFLNYLLTITDMCDCMKCKKIIDDIGIVASLDPVALDTATLELIKSNSGKTLEEQSQPNLNGWIQIDHAVKLGMGTKEYELITLTGE
jgi:uncharacterized Fe-S center protein